MKGESRSVKEIDCDGRRRLVEQIFRALSDLNKTLNNLLGRGYSVHVCSPAKDQHFNLLYIIGKIKSFNKIISSLPDKLHTDDHTYEEIQEIQISEPNRFDLHKKQLPQKIRTLLKTSHRDMIPTIKSQLRPCHTQRTFSDLQPKPHRKTKHISIKLPEQEKDAIKINHPMTPDPTKKFHMNSSNLTFSVAGSERRLHPKIPQENLCKDLKEMQQILQDHKHKRRKKERREAGLSREQLMRKKEFWLTDQTEDRQIKNKMAQTKHLHKVLNSVQYKS